MTKIFTGGLDSRRESLPISHWSNHSICRERTGAEESVPKSTPSNGIDMLCDQGPISTRLKPSRWRIAAKASRSLSTKLSYHPPTENTGVLIWSGVLAWRSRARTHRTPDVRSPRDTAATSHPSDAMSLVRSGRWSTNLLKSLMVSGGAQVLRHPLQTATQLHRARRWSRTGRGSRRSR